MAMCATEEGEERQPLEAFPGRLSGSSGSTVPMVTMVTITIITHQNNTRHVLAAPGQVLRERAEDLWKDQKLKDIKIT